MALLQAAVAGLITLIIAPGYLFYVDVTPKVTLLLAGTAAVLLWGAMSHAADPAPPSWFAFLLLGAALSLSVSTVFSTNPPLSCFGSNWRRFGAIEQSAVLLLAWLVATHIAGRPDDVRTILRGVAVAGVLSGIYGILQYLGVDPLLPAAAYHVGNGVWSIVRPPGTLGYVSYFANWLAMGTLLGLALAQLEERAGPALRRVCGGRNSSLRHAINWNARSIPGSLGGMRSAAVSARLAPDAPHSRDCLRPGARGRRVLLFAGGMEPAQPRARSSWLAAAITAGIVAQQFTTFTIPTAVLFYVTMGLCVGQISGVRGVLRRRLALRFLAAGALLYLAVRFTVADHSLELARRSVEGGNGAAAARYYAAADRQRLPGTASDLWYSRAMAALAQKTPDKLQRIRTAAQAGYAALRATKTVEDPFDAWYNVAALYARANDASYAEGSLRSAIAAHPNWFKPHWMLARIMLLEGRIDEARHEANLAVELDDAKHNEVLDTLQSCEHAPLQK